MNDRDYFGDQEPFEDDETENQPMTTADVVQNPSVQLGLVLLLVMLGLLVLWLTWMLLSSI